MEYFNIILVRLKRNKGYVIICTRVFTHNKTGFLYFLCLFTVDCGGI